jgi:uncharacterized glyoxalase superfamily protein PhnB
MHALPDGWPRISSTLYYQDPKTAIDWLCRAFGFEVRLVVETGEGKIAHSELVCGDGVIMVGTAGVRGHEQSPRSAGGNTQSLMMYVDDVDAHCQRARAHGARIATEPQISDYGDEYWTDRSYGAFDCEGHEWWFTQRVKTGNPAWSRVRNQRDLSRKHNA